MKEIKLEIKGKEYTVKIKEFGSKEAILEVNGTKYTVGLKDLGKELNVGSVREAVTPLATSPTTAPAQTSATSGVVSSGGSSGGSGGGSGGGSSEVLSPLPGLILNVMVKVGDTVKNGQNIIVMEAMKMENDVQATKDGVVKTINVKNGDNVSEGDVLATIE
ncbi:MAG: biotin/lipoyl-binding protein [Candidatus Delongbacteria bacterium]|jgi:biotin carboxyl carrier protein|nr:biotin/lipoyl-binding protein [Candidatus Delongbacteria bacterium]